MRASAIEFRLRMAIMVAVIALGFWSPWIEAWGIGQRISLFEWLALELSRTGLLIFTTATGVAIAMATLLAAAAVVLRVWGSAYLGPGIVNNAEMKAGAVMADGPYRHVRNPLYLGSWCMIAAMSFIMPVSGAPFVMVLLTVFLMRLILGEEAFLTAQLGEPYRAYLRAVPRLFPRVRTNLPQGGRTPRWGAGDGRRALVELQQPADDSRHPDQLWPFIAGAGDDSGTYAPGWSGGVSVRLPRRPRCVQRKPAGYLRP
jgi:protein-S-isoprenylcysteine O-methyltransferase Ste14